jgi:hypothetical protein
VKHDNPRRQPLTPDRRYTITPEYSGTAGPLFVVRFCGQWIAANGEQLTAELIAMEYEITRMQPYEQA